MALTEEGRARIHVAMSKDKKTLIESIMAEMMAAAGEGGLDHDVAQTVADSLSMLLNVFTASQAVSENKLQKLADTRRFMLVKDIYCRTLDQNPPGVREAEMRHAVDAADRLLGMLDEGKE